MNSNFDALTIPPIHTPQEFLDVLTTQIRELACLHSTHMSRAGINSYVITIHTENRPFDTRIKTAQIRISVDCKAIECSGFNDSFYSFTNVTQALLYVIDTLN